MPIAVRELDVADLSADLEVGPRYERALVLLRWKGVPVGQTQVRARDGRIDPDDLQGAIARAAPLIGELRAAEFLGFPVSGAEVSAPPATIAICTRDRPDDLARCLAALARLPNDGQEVLVIDSASAGKETREVVRAHAGVRYVREDRPGLDRARNRALREATNDIVAFTDDDAVPDPAWLRALAGNFVDPRTACVNGLTMPLELETAAQEWFEVTNSFVRGFWRTVFDGLECDCFFVARVGAGANMALRRSAIEVVGPFDEALDAGTPTRSGGDHDLFTRLLAAGYRVVYEPRALSRHRHRREWAELRDAIRGYGTGVYAYLTRQWMAGETRAPVVALRWLPWQLRLLARGLLGRPGGAPPRLVLAELGGCAAGPLAYRRSVRQLRDRT